ncbi:unnamed protein product [Urochloa humidicola]
MHGAHLSRSPRRHAGSVAKAAATAAESPFLASLSRSTTARTAAAATLPASPRLPAELLRLVVHGRDSGVTFADFPYNLRLPSIDKLIMHQDTNCVWSATFCLQVHHLLAIPSIASLISNHLELSAAVHVL